MVVDEQTRLLFPRILGFVAASVAATWIVSSRLTPIFESTATVDIDRQTPVGVVGQDATRNSLNDADQFLATQMKLVESDSVLRPVDRRFDLRQHEHQAVPYQSGRGQEAPVALRRLKVVRPPNTYLIQIGYRSEDPQLITAGIVSGIKSHAVRVIHDRGEAIATALKEAVTNPIGLDEDGQGGM